MKISQKSWGLNIICRREKKINPRPQYQRTRVWGDIKNQLLIDSILRKYDIPKIYLTNSKDSKYEHEVIDGQQRLEAIWGFYNGDYALGGYSKNLLDSDLSGKKYSELSSDIQDEMDMYELSVIIIEDATKEEIRDLFWRLQEGVALNPPEKRNAMVGGMRDFISDLTSPDLKFHKVFKILPKKDRRFMYADWLAHVVCLELANGSTDVKAKNLEEMYKNNKYFKMSCKDADKIKLILNFIAESFVERTPELDIKWGFVDFYLLISLLINDYAIKKEKQGFASFYTDFEKERREVEDETILIKSGDLWSEDLYDYIKAFKQSGGVKKNIEIRNQVYTRKLFREITNLETKDPKRLFDNSQKIVIWRRDNQTCKQCKCKVKFDEMHADHITPHSKGGLTTIENGQTLCVQCNLKKGSK